MSGGRLKFVAGSQARILKLDGHASEEVYTVLADQADRRGHVLLQEPKTGKQFPVNQRRVLPQLSDDTAVVVESADRCRAVCPRCPYLVEVRAGDEIMECPDHGSFKLHWLGVKPMADATTTKKQGQPSATKSGDKTSQAAEPVQVDFESLAKLEDCELWTKSNVRFDHSTVDVKAHVLLYTGDSPRKLCFNTYNGTLGKRGKPLPIDGFLADEPVQDKKPWFVVKDLEKTRQTLQQKHYEQQ